MANAGFIISDKMEIVGGGQVHIHQRVLLVGKATLAKFSVEANENAVVKARRKSGRRKGNIIGAFALGAGQRVRQRLKGDEWLDALAPDQGASPVGNVIGRKAEIRDDAVADLRGGNQIKFVRTERFIGINQTVNAIVSEIQIARDRVEGKARRITEASGNAAQIGGDDIGKVIGKGQHVDRVACKDATGARYVGAAESGRSGRFGEVLVGTELEEQVAAFGLTRSGP